MTTPPSPTNPWTAVPLVKMAAVMTVEASTNDPEPFTDADQDRIREFWNEANPDADGLLDAEPWES